MGVFAVWIHLVTTMIVPHTFRDQNVIFMQKKIVVIVIMLNKICSVAAVVAFWLSCGNAVWFPFDGNHLCLLVDVVGGIIAATQILG